MAVQETKYLDYEGLKKTVSCIMAEVPEPDGTTIYKNKDGKISTRDNKPTVNADTGVMIFPGSAPTIVDGSSLVIL